MFIIFKIIQQHTSFEIPSDTLARTNLSTYFQVFNNYQRPREPSPQGATW